MRSGLGGDLYWQILHIKLIRQGKYDTLKHDNIFTILQSLLMSSILITYIIAIFVYYQNGIKRKLLA